VAVHADWMPRNLMLPAAAATSPAGQGPLPGILDFQDAVSGPITYDTASLLRDAFISWNEEQELDWAVRGWQMQRKAGLPVNADFGEHWRQLEWMGLQRHLKVLGIFCRLKHRDGKERYAQDLPRFLGYATRVALRYGPLKPLLRLLEPLSGQEVKQGFTF
jgi:aminoglycoside/choline kinase family phosphotransferase